MRVYKILILCGLVFYAFLGGAEELTASEYEHQLEKHSLTLFLLGKGEAPLTEKDPKFLAETRAVTDLAAQIKIEVKEIIISQLLEKDTTIKERAEIFAQTIIDSMEVKGIYIAYSEADKEKGVHRAICVLRREDAAKWLSEDIDDAYESANNYFNLAKEEVSNLDIKLAFSHLSSALKSLIKGKAYEEEYSVIVALMDSSVSYEPNVIPKSYPDIQFFFDKITDAIKLEKISGDNQSGKHGEGLSKPLEVKFSYNETPLPNFTIDFSFEKGIGELDKEVITDSVGKALCGISELPHNVKEAVNINAGIDLTELLIPPLIFSKEIKFKVGFKKSTLSWIVSQVISKLKAELPKRIVAIVVKEFTQGATGLASSFSRGLCEQCVHQISERDEIQIGSYRSIEPGTSCELEGNYRDCGDSIEINAYIKDANSVVLCSTTIRVSKDEILAESLSLKPARMEELQEKVSYLTQTEISIGQPQELPLLEVKVWTPRRVYEDGETLTIFVKPKVDCYIKVFNYQSDGRAVQIFPNDYSISGFMKGNRIYEIPKDVEAGRGFDLVITPPFGIDVIKVYASKHPFGEEQVNQYYDGKAGPYKIYDNNYRGLDRAISVVPKGGFATASYAITTTKVTGIGKVHIMEGSRWQK